MIRILSDSPLVYFNPNLWLTKSTQHICERLLFVLLRYKAIGDFSGFFPFRIFSFPDFWFPDFWFPNFLLSGFLVSGLQDIFTFLTQRIMTQEEKEKGKKKMRTNESDNLSHREHMPNSRREERVKRKRGHSSSLTEISRNSRKSLEIFKNVPNGFLTVTHKYE